MVKITIALAVLVVFMIIIANLSSSFFRSRLTTVSHNTQSNSTEESDSGSYIDENNSSVVISPPLKESDYIEVTSKYNFDNEYCPYFQLLNDEQKKAYYFIYDAAEKVEPSLYIGSYVKIASSEVSDVVNAVYYDHPELFWLEPGFRYTYGSHHMVVTVKLQFNGLEKDLTTAKRDFNLKVNEIVSEVNKASSKGFLYQEVKLHDILCSICTYDENAQYDQSAYSCLVGGSSVCSGYARAFQVIMNKMNVPTYYIVGKVRDGGDHAWNIIKIDGQFYNVDVTWDDNLGEKRSNDVHAYFNITDSAISKTHTRSEFSSKLPSCTDDSKTYGKNLGDTITIDDLNW